MPVCSSGTQSQLYSAASHFKEGNTLWRQRKDFDAIFKPHIGNVRKYNRSSALTEGKARAFLISSLRPIVRLIVASYRA